MATLLKTGIKCGNALTPMPSDSFPGMLALVTGGIPVSTDVFYDDGCDGTWFKPFNKLHSHRACRSSLRLILSVPTGWLHAKWIAATSPQPRERTR
jgi:hypothetical protein